LLDGDAHTPIWTQRFDGVLDDVFALQDEVSNAVAARIDSSIQSNEMQQANRRLTKDQGAYDLFLRGSHNMWAKYDETELREAISLFDQAIALDPQFALAMVLSSNACLNLQQWNVCADKPELLARTPGPNSWRSACRLRSVRYKSTGPIIGFPLGLPTASCNAANRLPRSKD
ncbi:MAG: hypothetical protein RL367_2900, partial [Pseudomonadota bacterium]